MGAHERNIVGVELFPTDIESTSGVVCAKRGSAKIFSGIFTDTRFPVRGGIFLGLKGEQYDGSSFAQDAVKAGAKGVVITDGLPLPEGDVHVFYHTDVLFAFGELAKAHRKKIGSSVVAISGSLGKTTVKEMVGRIFKNIFGEKDVFVSEGNLNNLVGVPLNIFRLKSQRIAVLELGTSRRGELSRLGEIAQPNVSAITTVAPVHLEFFGDIDGVLRAKWELVETTSDDSLVILNRDNELLVKKSHEVERKIIWFGESEESDVQMYDLQLFGFDGSKLSVKWRGEVADCTIKAAGRHQAKNALCALAIACALGLELKQVCDALSGFEPYELRGRLFKRGDWTVIDDSYNASPDAVRQALDMLEFGNGTKVAVLGHMRELGDASKKLHFEVGQAAAEKSDVLIAVGEFSDEVKSGAVFAGMEESQIFCASDWCEALEILKSKIFGKSTILVKASRLVGLDRLVKALEES